MFIFVIVCLKKVEKKHFFKNINTKEKQNVYLFEKKITKEKQTKDWDDTIWDNRMWWKCL